MINPTAWAPVIGDLPLQSFTVDSASPTRAVVTRLEQDPALAGVLIVDGLKLTGMVSKQKCFEWLSRPFGTEVFLARPIQALQVALGLTPTILSAHTPIEQAVQIALGRPSEQLYEPVVTRHPDHGWRLLPVPQLLLAQAESLAQANRLIGQQVRMGQALTSTLELQRVLELILVHIAEVVPYDWAGLLTPEADGWELAAFRSGAGTQPASVDNRVAQQLQEIARTRRAVCLPAVAPDAATRGMTGLWPPGQAWLGVPLVHAELVLGVVALARQSPGVYGPTELALLQASLGQAAVALQNARLYEMTQRLAVTDVLTQVSNRRHVFELATQEFDRAARYDRSLAVIMLDVDHFKQLNDLHGHLIGDQALKLLAARCRLYLRAVDVLGRYGGEEFVVFLPETGPAEAEHVAERLRQGVTATPFETEAGPLKLTVSMGVAAVWPARTEAGLEALVDRADKALYAAKHWGRNCVRVWTPHLRLSPLETSLSASREANLAGPNWAQPDRGPALAAGEAVPDWAETKPESAEQLRRRLTRLEAISRVSAAMRTARTIDELLPPLLDEVLDTLASADGAIILIDPSTRELRPAVARGWPTSLLTPLPPAQASLVATALLKITEIWWSPAPRHDPRWPAALWERLPDSWSVAYIPLLLTSEVVGGLIVSVPLPRELTAEECELLHALAELAGNALHRMRLNEQTERRVRQLTALRMIDMLMSDRPDRSVLLDLLLNQTVAQLGAHAVAVLLFDPLTERLHFQAGRGFYRPAIRYADLPLAASVAGRAALRRTTLYLDQFPSPDLPPEFADFVAGEGFSAYYAVPLLTNHRLIGVLEIFQRAPLPPEPEWQTFLEALAGRAALALDHVQLVEGLRESNRALEQAYDRTLESWTRALAVRDRETEGHSQRVTQMTLQLARALGLTEADLVHVRRGALLHDVGKMGIPDAVLLKPGPLTPEERRLIEQHPVIAYEWLGPIPFLRPALDIPYAHHEKWDGTGYPRGLRGAAIPLAARLFAVVDVWDALRSHRPYRPAWPEAQARAYLQAEAGRHFDPAIVAKFLVLLDAIDLGREVVAVLDPVHSA